MAEALLAPLVELHRGSFICSNLHPAGGGVLLIAHSSLPSAFKPHGLLHSVQVIIACLLKRKSAKCCLLVRGIVLASIDLVEA
jgi:hypothetical protein